MPKKSRQKFKYLENEKSFKDELKSIFRHFWRVIIETNKKNFFWRVLFKIYSKFRLFLKIAKNVLT